MKLLILFAVLFVQSLSAFPRDFRESTSHTLCPLCYAKYHYTYNGVKFLLVFTYTGQNKFLLTYKNLSDVSEVGRFTVDYSKDGVGAILESVSSKPDSTSHLVLHALLLNMMEIYDRLYALDYGPFDSKIIYDLYYGENTIYYRFDKWIPLFNLYGIYSNRDKEYLLELVDVGEMKDGSSADILYADATLRMPDPFAYRIPEEEAIEVELNNVKLRLDKNWIRKKQSWSGMDSYWMESDSRTNAFIGAFHQDNALDKQQILTSLAAALIGDHIDPSTLRVWDSDQGISFQFEMIDPSTGYATTTRTRYVLGEDWFDIVVLNTYSSVYSENRAYFEDVLGRFK